MSFITLPSDRLSHLTDTATLGARVAHARGSFQSYRDFYRICRPHCPSGVWNGSNRS